MSTPAPRTASIATSVPATTRTPPRWPGAGRRNSSASIGRNKPARLTSAHSRASGNPELFRDFGSPLPRGQAEDTVELEPPLLHQHGVAGAQGIAERHLAVHLLAVRVAGELNLIHISEPTRQ